MGAISTASLPDIVFMLLFWSAMCAIIGGIGYLGS